MHNWYTQDLIKGMPHWQSPPWLDDRSGFDARKIIQAYKDAGIKTITPHAKHVDGYCYYPSKFRETKPEKDFLGEMVSEAKRCGMRVIPYYMVVVDKWSASEHPEWRCFNGDGTVKEGFGSIFCCINNEAYASLVLGQVSEIMENYDVDGIWSDELNWGDYGCFCSHCQALFGRKYGLNLIEAKGKNIARTFFNDCWEAFAGKMHDIVRGKDSGKVFIYNGGGLHSYGSSFGKYTISNCCEAHAALFASERGRYMNRLDKPFEICYLTEKDWGGLPHNTKDEVRLIAAEITAHGGTAMLATSFTPQGRLLQDGMEMVKDACSYVGSIREYLTDISPVYDMGILWPGAEEPKMGYAMMQNDVLYCYPTMEQQWSDLRLVYSQAYIKKAPEAEGIKDDVDDVFIDGNIPGDLKGCGADKVREYVRSGGIFVMEVPHPGAHAAKDVRFALSDVMGVEFAGVSTYESHYIKPVKAELTEGIPLDIPLLVNERAYRIRNNTAQVWAQLLYPLKPLDKFYKMQKFIPNAPDERIEATPAITVNRYGKGYGVCIAAPLSRAAMALNFGKGHPYHYWPRKFLSNLVNTLMENPLTRPSTPLGVEILVNFQKKERRYVVHLFNHYGLRGVPYARESYYEPNPETVRLAGVKLAINEDRTGEIKAIRRVREKDSLAVHKDGRWRSITIPEMGQHEIIVLDI